MTGYPKDRNGWSEWSRHVLSELKRLNAGGEARSKDITELKIAMEKGLHEVQVEIAMLKVKSGFWGLAGSALGMILFILGQKFLK